MRLMRLVRLIKFGRITEQLQINHLSSTGVWLRLCRLASTLLLVGRRDRLSYLALTRVCVVSSCVGHILSARRRPSVGCCAGHWLACAWHFLPLMADDPE